MAHPLPNSIRNRSCSYSSAGSALKIFFVRIYKHIHAYVYICVYLIPFQNVHVSSFFLVKPEGAQGSVISPGGAQGTLYGTRDHSKSGYKQGYKIRWP